MLMDAEWSNFCKIRCQEIDRQTSRKFDQELETLSIFSLDHQNKIKISAGNFKSGS